MVLSWISCMIYGTLRLGAKEITAEIHHLLETMAKKHDEVQCKLDKNGLRKHIANKFKS